MPMDSRTAPKFVIRYASTEMRDRVAASSERQLISINTFINQAIAEKLDRGEAFDQLIALALRQLVSENPVEAQSGALEHVEPTRTFHIPELLCYAGSRPVTDAMEGPDHG